MDHQYPTVAKTPVLVTGKFKQWQFWIQQYLQHEHYALWEVIEFDDSYVVPVNTTDTTGGDKSIRTLTLTAEDMQRKKNDVKARTTLLLSLLDEHQLRFSKYKTARELWAAILKTFGGDEATKKKKKNLLKKQYGNFKAEGSETLDGSQIKFEDINKIDEDDIEEMDIKWNMALLSMRVDKFWKKTCKKISIHGSDVAGFDKSKSYMANDEEDHALVADEVAPTEFALMANTSAESKVFDNSLCSKDYKKNNDSLNNKITDLTDKLFDANNFIYHYKLALAQVESRLVECKEREVKYIEKIRTLEYYNKSYKEGNDSLKKKLETLQQEKEGVNRKLAGLLTASKDLDNLIKSQRSEKNKEGLGYTAVPPPTAQLYLSPKKDLSWTGLPECADDTVTDYSRPSPTVETISEDDQNRNPSEIVASPITSKLLSRQFQNKIDDKGYWDSGCSRHMTGNISYLSDFEPYDRGYVFVGQEGCKITGKGTIKTGKLEFENVYFVKDLKYNLFSVSQIYDNKNSVLFNDSECIVLRRDFKLLDDANILLRTPRQHNMYSIDLNNIVPHRDLTCLVAKASANECMLWHRRLGHLNLKTMNKLVRHNL
nr:ribonuclease H-like domain-containing protein [Tanacetum cinerariifolium]